MPPISVMIKPASSLCNLSCRYCFYHSLAGQRESFSHGMMSLPTAERIAVEALTYARGEDVHFAFQGGEPLLAGLPFFEAFVAAAASHNCHGSKIYYSIQTNGILIDRNWCRFLKKQRFLVGLSLDGPEEVHNLYRKDAKGEGTFSQVMQAAGMLRDFGVDFNILTVVTPRGARDISRVYSFFKTKGFRYLQFIPYLAPLGTGAEDELYLSPDLYASYLLELFKSYYADYKAGSYISIRQFDNYVQLANGNRAEQCGMNGHCSLQFVIEGDGTVYPCDFYCLDEYALGSIHEYGFKELAVRGMMEFVTTSLKTDGACEKCSYYSVCRRGCKRYEGDLSYCAAYKKFFSYALPYMKVMR